MTIWIKVLLVYCVIINIVAFATYGIDKYKAIHKKWRIPELSLILLAWFGGSIGAILGMLLFHHKTRKIKFKVWVPLALIVHLICLLIIVFKIFQAIDINNHYRKAITRLCSIQLHIPLIGISAVKICQYIIFK